MPQQTTLADRLVMQALLAIPARRALTLAVNAIEGKADAVGVGAGLPPVEPSSALLLVQTIGRHDTGAARVIAREALAVRSRSAVDEDALAEWSGSHLFGAQSRDTRTAASIEEEYEPLTESPPLSWPSGQQRRSEESGAFLHSWHMPQPMSSGPPNEDTITADRHDYALTELAPGEKTAPDDARSITSTYASDWANLLDDLRAGLHLDESEKTAALNVLRADPVIGPALEAASASKDTPSSRGEHGLDL